jgi:mannose-6-phosphate isomerase-like protein (cupin superfamily)
MTVHDVPETVKKLGSQDSREFATVNGCAVGVFRTPQDSWLWERHPDGDELLYILQGELEMTLLRESISEQASLRPGSLFVVPKGVWHRPYAKTDVRLLYVTPARTETSMAEDPRSTA